MSNSNSFDVPMKTILHILIFTLSLSLIAGCASTKPFAWDNVRKLQVGMTKKEVTQIMGKPYLISSGSEDSEIWEWSFGRQGRTYHIVLKEGKVSEVPPIPKGPPGNRRN